MSMTIRIDAKVHECKRLVKELDHAIRVIDEQRFAAIQWHPRDMDEPIRYARKYIGELIAALSSLEKIDQEYQREYEAARAEAAAFIWHSLRKWGEPTQIDTHAVDCGCTYCN